jgi:hypothetical protein
MVSVLGLCLSQGIAWAQGEGNAKEFALQASLDPILDWRAPLSLSSEKLEAAYVANGFSSSPYYGWSPDKTKAHLGRKPFSNITVDLTAFGGKLPIEDVMIHFQDGKSEAMEIGIEARFADLAATELTRVLKDEPTRRLVSRTGMESVVFAVWKWADGLVIQSKGGPISVIRIVKSADAHLAYLHDAGDGSFAMICDLDFLLDYPTAWGMSTDGIEKRFDVSDRGFKEQPFFKWLSAGKERLRFSRQPFSNITVDLRLFGGRVSADEAVIDFKNGNPSIVSVSVYNRGDSGGMGPSEFDALFKACGQSLGQLLEVSPQRQQPGASAAVKTVGYLWRSPLCIAQLEHNDYAGTGKNASQPEFLRLKLASPGNKDWSFGSSPTGLLTSAVGKTALLRNVTKSVGGDVFIKGIPMVDQGAKGYCVVASCQRLFEYYKIACDQHEMAQLAGSSAETGTSSLAMEAVLDRIDNRFKTRFKPLISPSMRRERNYKQPDGKKFTEMIQEYVNQGVPLLWALNLGVAEEDPPLPSGGQIAGGHMRMIIGYNQAKNKLIFTDSWGAGHEMKRMSLTAALPVTSGLYILQPRS